jgi:hypothetical protein
LAQAIAGNNDSPERANYDLSNISECQIETEQQLCYLDEAELLQSLLRLARPANAQLQTGPTPWNNCLNEIPETIANFGATVKLH